MDDGAVIRVKNLGKLYRLGQQVSVMNLRDAITNTFTAPFRKRKQNSEPKISDSRYIWALKDVSFEIKRGEIVGIIGRNGSGKSTLLKILSRITAPTEGYAEIHGRVGSLLEVGTGFNPELTGRENIYLNGAIIGMKKREIDNKFEEIVAFSEIEKFIDTPVKYYSSGMQVRLAFAVAAHLEPEILLVDEVLAVGDVGFQRKCLGNMREVSEAGRTVLLVSHNMAAVNALCSRTILLDNARVVKIGNTADIVSSYLMEKPFSERAEVTISNVSKAEMAFTRIWISDINGNITSKVDIKKPFKIWLEYLVRKPNKKAEISIFIKNSMGASVIFSSISDSLGGSFHSFEPGKYISSVLIDGDFLIPDMYLLKVSAHYRGVREIDAHENILSFEILETGSVMAPYGKAARHLCCVLGGTKWESFYSEANHEDLTRIKDDAGNGYNNK